MHNEILSVQKGAKWQTYAEMRRNSGAEWNELLFDQSRRHLGLNYTNLEFGQRFELIATQSPVKRSDHTKRGL